MSSRQARTGHDDDEEGHGSSRRQSRRQANSDPEPEAPEPDNYADVNMMIDAIYDEEAQLAKKLVRYALACEYARVPIRREGIRNTVLMPSYARAFNMVFEKAQKQLRDVFGMQMLELPLKEKRTLKEKQKATARKASTQTVTSSKQYILVSILPKEYSSHPIIAPSRVPSATQEAEYVGFYSIIIALIVLSGGELSNAKLRRHLARFNASKNLPLGSTDSVLAKLVRQGYLDKVMDKSESNPDADDDALVTWCVGSRGRVEVPPKSIIAIVSEVYGDQVPKDFHTRLYKSFGLQENGEGQAANGASDD